MHCYMRVTWGWQLWGCHRCCSVSSLQWPDRIILCNSAITALDFSSNIPSQLAVGMLDGTIAVYDVQSEEESCVVSSRWGMRGASPRSSYTAKKQNHDYKCREYRNTLCLSPDHLGPLNEKLFLTINICHCFIALISTDGAFVPCCCLCCLPNLIQFYLCSTQNRKYFTISLSIIQ